MALNIKIIRSLKINITKNQYESHFSKSSKHNNNKTTKKTQLNLEIVTIAIYLVFNKVHRAIENLVLKRSCDMVE